MSPVTIIVIFLTTGFTCAEVYSRITERRPYYNRHQHRNVTSYLKPRFDTNKNRINLYNKPPVFHYSINPQRRINRREPKAYTSGVYRIYGTGKATIPDGGESVTVFNSGTHTKTNKGTITARVLDPRTLYKGNCSVIKPSKKKCRCPRNRVILASRGNSQVVLPEPCDNLRWFSLSGPKPGSFLKEGSYSLIGRLGTRGKICQYEYKVLVRRCESLNVEGGKTNCTSENVWGSACTITCDDGYDLKGEKILNCRDNLKWSSETPTCVKRIGCKPPQTPDDTKIWCQVPNEKDLVEDMLPARSYCRFKTEGRQHTIFCIDGYWVTKHKKGRRSNHVKY